MTFNPKLTKVLLLLVFFLYGSLGLDYYLGNLTWVRALLFVLASSVLLLVITIANYHFEEWQERRKRERQLATKLASKSEK